MKTKDGKRKRCQMFEAAKDLFLTGAWLASSCHVQCCLILLVWKSSPTECADSLTAEPIDSNNPLFTGAASAEGAVSNRAGRRQKVQGAVIICEFGRSAQHRPNAPFLADMAATSAALGFNCGQQGLYFSNLVLQLRPNSAPRWPQLGPVNARFHYAL